MIALLSALWLGILTSISPCPLATNIAAVSFLSKNANHPRFVLLSGLTYTLGRMVAYFLMGFIIISSLAGIPVTARFLQKYMNIFLGPLLVIVGFFLVYLFTFTIKGLTLSMEKQQGLARSGLAGSFLLGFLFAVSFCPLSAALFFGSLLPLAISENFGLLFPFVYGLGTALPVVAFSIAVALSVQSLTRWFQNIKRIEKYLRKTTGVLFIIIGSYYTWVYILSPVLMQQ